MGIKIFVDKDITNPTIRVSWCVDKETLETLRRNNVSRPAVVIVAVKKFGECDYLDVERQVVALEEGSTYFPVPSSGGITLHVFVSGQEFKMAKDCWLLKEEGIYANTMIGSGSGELVVNYANDSVNLVVPWKLFPERSEWERNLSAIFFSSGPENECKNRWRRVFLALLLLVLGPFMYLWRVVVTLTTLVALKKPRWEFVWKLTLPSKGIWTQAGDSGWREVLYAIDDRICSWFPEEWQRSS